MTALRTIGRTLRRGLALLVLGLIRGRRVIAVMACVAVVAFLALAFFNPNRTAPTAATAARPGRGRAASGAQPATGGRATQPPATSSSAPNGQGAPTTGSVVAPGSAEVAIQQAIQKGDEAQARAIVTGDPTVMQGSATDAYYQESVRGNQDLLAGGVKSIHLDKLEWGQITVSGDVATATAYETWTTVFVDGTTQQSRDLNVYGLVRQNGVWLVASDEHPDAAGEANGQPFAPPARTNPANPTGPGRNPGGRTAPGAAPAPSRRGADQGMSSNWSGYAATGGQYTAVSGTWTVPRTTTGSPASQSAVWVGIGGEASRDLIQAGTEEIVTGQGSVRYDAWIELLPAGPHTVPLPVKGGDTVTVTITQAPNNAGWNLDRRPRPAAVAARCTAYPSDHTADLRRSSQAGALSLVPSC